MKQALATVKNAVATKDVVQSFTHYYVHERMITATDGKLTASSPFPCDGTFLVPATEFEQVLGRMPGDPKVTVEDDHIKIRAGRYSGTIQTLNLNDHSLLEAEGDKVAIDGELFLSNLRTLRPFISDNAVYNWSIALIMGDTGAYCTNNIVVVHCPDFPLKPTQARLLPIFAIEFLLAREPISHYSECDTFMCFYWPDGSWVRTPYIDQPFPEQVQELVTSQTYSSCTILSEEWKDVFYHLAGMCDEVVTFYPDKTVVGRGKAKVEADIQNNVPEGEEYTRWNAKNFSLVVQHADKMDFSNYPKPCAFTSDTIRGIIVGTR